MAVRPSILFTATFSSSFIQRDLDILREHFNVTPLIGSGPFFLLRMLPRILLADITFSWFASVYSSLLIAAAVMFRKRTVLILGGADVAKMPEYSYGIWNSRWRAMIVRYGIMHADRVLAVDESIKQDACRLAQYDGNNIDVLPTGYDPEQWKPGGEKLPVILTVAQCDTWGRAMIKGVDFFCDVARALPERRFLIVGLAAPIAAQFPFPQNVTVLPSLSREQLLRHYQNAEIYFQPSRRDGFPNALCEAMLCGCRPVGTDVGGIPTIMGTIGRIVPFGDVRAAVHALIDDASATAGSSGRQRIVELFSLKRRTEGLHSTIRKVYAHS